MADDSAIRRANLVRFFKTPKAAAAALGGENGLAQYSYWASLMNDPNKSFGEKMARKIEERMEWPRGSLDEPDFSPSAAPQQPSPDAHDWRRAAYDEASAIRDEDLRNWALAFLERVDNSVEERRKLVALAPKITREVNSSHAMSGQTDKK